MTLPEGRYGPAAAAPPRWRRPALVAGGLAVAALAGWWAVQATAGPVQVTTVGYVVHDDRVDVTWQVARPAGTALTCRVRALSASYAEVGVVDLEVAPGEPVVRSTTTVPTTERAVSGLVESCLPTDR